MPLKLTEQQNKVFEAIKDFLDGDASVFILKGHAGTGKTTMVRQIADYIKNNLHRLPELMAPTGRAARVLTKKTGMDATTIHKRIYDKDHYEIKEVKDIAESDFKIVFQIKRPSDSVIAIVDEASLLSSKKSEHELFQFGTGILLNDLLTYIRPSFGGKVIFVRDPAQLPPVGGNHSFALDEKYFEDKGLKYSSASLTQVLRQGGNSIILKNAMQIRDILSSQQQRNILAFKEKQGEVESLQPKDVVSKYMDTGADAAIGESVVIAYPNRKVANYNKEIRCRKYNQELPLQPGDSLMVVRNNYNLSTVDGEGTQLMNGDFTKVVSCGEIETLSAPVYVQRGGEKERITIKINVREAMKITAIYDGEKWRTIKAEAFSGVERT